MISKIGQGILKLGLFSSVQIFILILSKWLLLTCLSNLTNNIWSWSIARKLSSSVKRLRDKALRVAPKVTTNKKAEPGKVFCLNFAIWKCKINPKTRVEQCFHTIRRDVGQLDTKFGDIDNWKSGWNSERKAKRQVLKKNKQCN